MSAESQSPPFQNVAEGRAAPPRVAAEPAKAEPRLAFRTALGRYKGGRLAAIRLRKGLHPMVSGYGLWVMQTKSRNTSTNHRRSTPLLRDSALDHEWP